MKTFNDVAVPLGVVYLVVVIATVASNLLLGNTADSQFALNFFLENSTKVRVSVLLDLISSAGIVVLAVVLYTILKEQSRILALLGLGWWLAESIVLAVSKIHFLSLLALSQDLPVTLSADAAIYSVLGASLLSAAKLGYVVVLLFFSLGGMAFYYLFYRSGLLPRFLSVWGLVGAVLACAASGLAILGINPPNLFFAINVLFEVIVGFWLIVKGFNTPNGNPVNS